MKLKITKLRQGGKSYREIERLTGVNRGSISYYCSSGTRDAKRLQRLKRRDEKKQQCVDYKGGECVVCGFNKFLAALEFHHLDPKIKDQNMAKQSARNLPFEKMKKELDKCVLLCANCHRGVHSKEINLK